MPAPTPIFLFGVSQRSGTNFLANLLLCHRDCVAPKPPVLEGHLLAEAPRLLDYARRTARRWPQRWGDRATAEDAIVTSLGAGLVGFLNGQGEENKRVVVKTPSTENLHLAPRLFPGAPVLVLVRDGRSAAESLHTGFRRSYSGAIKTWRAGARRILAATGDQYLVVRYEDLVAKPERELTRVLDHAGLDREGFDFEAARQLPVVGSSFVKVDGGLTWEPVARPSGFDPSTRFASWPASRHERFNWLARREQEALGYEVDNGSPRPAYNLLLDAATPFIRARDTFMHLRWRLRSNLRQ